MDPSSNPLEFLEQLPDEATQAQRERENQLRLHGFSPSTLRSSVPFLQVHLEMLQRANAAQNEVLVHARETEFQNAFTTQGRMDPLYADTACETAQRNHNVFGSCCCYGHSDFVTSVLTNAGLPAAHQASPITPATAMGERRLAMPPGTAPADCVVGAVMSHEFARATEICEQYYGVGEYCQAAAAHLAGFGQEAKRRTYCK